MIAVGFVVMFDLIIVLTTWLGVSQEDQSSMPIISSFSVNIEHLERT